MSDVALEAVDALRQRLLAVELQDEGDDASFEVAILIGIQVAMTAPEWAAALVRWMNGLHDTPFPSAAVFDIARRFPLEEVPA